MACSGGMFADEIRMKDYAKVPCNYCTASVIEQ